MACRGSSPISWSWPDHVMNGTERISIINFNSEDHKKPYCSNLTLSDAQAKDTGYFYCNTSSSNIKQRKTAIYIFVKDKHNPFVKQYAEVPKVLYVIVGQRLLIPCRTTAPHFNVTLKLNDHSLTIDGKKVMWDSKQGFVIPRTTLNFTGLLSCETTVNGNTFYSYYLTHRKVNRINSVQLNVTSPVKMLSGRSLAIKCTVTTELNSRVAINWDFPGKGNRNNSILKRIDQSDHMINTFYSTLVIDKVLTSDKGNYICQVRNGDTGKKRKATVNVYEKPFISARCRKSCVAEVLAGQAVYHFPIKVKAFPPPDVLWLKNGQPITERSIRYNITGHELIIRDVSEEDGGSYSIILELKQWKLFKNITFTLNVNGASPLLKMEKLKQPTEFQKAIIIDYHLCKKSTREISRRTGVPKSSVKLIINKYMKRSSVVNKSCSERAKKVHGESHHSLRKKVKQNRKGNRGITLRFSKDM